jgi:glycosyltransferase involved in cell wall biosynthesis
MVIKHRKKPIVYFDAQVLLGEKTGVGYFCYTLIEELASAMPEIQFVGHVYDFMLKSSSNLPQGENISYIRNPFMPVQIINLLRRFRVEIPIELRAFKRVDAALHLNYLSTPSLLRVPAIGFIYDMSFVDFPQFVSEKNQQDLKRFVPVTLKRCREIITISRFSEARLKHYYPALTNHISVLPIPPRSTKTKPANISDKLINQGILPNKYIFYIGTIEPRKNITGLLQAYSLLPHNVRNEYALVLSGGKGWQDDDIIAAIGKAQKTGLNIICTGYITQNEKSALYQHASCFVLPSHYEGFGMPIFEAMEHDTPVAVSDIPVFHEVAGNAAQYFDKDNPENIAKKINELLTSSKLRASLSRRARKRLGYYSWSANIKSLHALLEQSLYNE